MQQFSHFLHPQEKKIPIPHSYSRTIIPALLPPSYPPSSYKILPLHPSLQTPINTPLPKPKPETNCNCKEQAIAKQRRTPTIMVRNRPTFLDLVHTPQVQAR